MVVWCESGMGGFDSAACACGSSDSGKGAHLMGTGCRRDLEAVRFFFSWMRQSSLPAVLQLEQGTPTVRASQRTLRWWQ